MSGKLFQLPYAVWQHIIEYIHWQQLWRLDLAVLNHLERMKLLDILRNLKVENTCDGPCSLLRGIPRMNILMRRGVRLLSMERMWQSQREEIEERERLLMTENDYHSSF